MRKTTIDDLKDLVQKLQSERQEHLDAIAGIDDAFARLGITLESRPRRGRPPKKRFGKTGVFGRPGRKGRRRRRRYATSGTESVLAYIGRHGGKGTSGGQIANHWKSEGRAGSSYNILGSLVKTGKIKRRNVKGQRGSVYLAA